MMDKHTCLACGQSYRGNVGFNSHVDSRHKKTHNYQFTSCLNRFVSKGELAVHKDSCWPIWILNRSLEKGKRISKENEAFADEVGSPFMETSSENASNVEENFMAMSAEIKNM